MPRSRLHATGFDDLGGDAGAEAEDHDLTAGAPLIKEQIAQAEVDGYAGDHFDPMDDVRAVEGDRGGAALHRSLSSPIGTPEITAS
jgi:hypothetical protein